MKRSFSCLILAGLLLAASAGASASVERPQLVSRASGRHGAASSIAYGPSIDGRGRRVVFFSGFGQRAGIFLRDIGRQRTRLLTEGSEPSIDAAGDRIAFALGSQVYGLDLMSGRRVIVSAPEPESRGRASGRSGEQVMAAAGRYVAFASTRTDLLSIPHSRVSTQALGMGQVYVRDLKTEKTALVSRAAGRERAIGDQSSRSPEISANGRLVVFVSEADNLVPGASQGEAVYVRNMRTKGLRLISTDASNPALSADGRYVAFELNRFGRPEAIIVENLKTGARVDATRISSTPIRVQLGAEPVLSSDGRFIAFRGGLDRFGLQKLFLVDLAFRRVQASAYVGDERKTRFGFSAKGRFVVYDDYVQSIPGRESGERITESGQVFRLANPFPALRPPLPFSGEGTYSARKRRLAGDLDVAFPGLGPQPLTGDPFEARLVPERRATRASVGTAG